MSNKPKIAIVLNTAWNIYNFRLGLIKALINFGYEVIAIAPADDSIKEIEATGCQFIPLENLSRKGLNPIREYQLINELTAIYRKEKIEIALHYTIKPVIYGTIAASRLGVKTINTLTGLGYAFLSKGIVNKIVEKLYRYTLKKANYVFFQNQDDKTLFLKRKLVSPEKVDVINGSGINVTYFSSDKYPSSEEGIHFLFIGRLLHDKGIREYIKAANLVIDKFPHTNFHIVGGLDKENPSGILEEELTEWTIQKHINYHGKVKDTRPFIENAHVVVLPSYREGLPRVMLEGMSMSRPLITTYVPGCRETVIDGENGYLVDAKDSKALAEGMKKMIMLNNIERSIMGRQGREMACEKFEEGLIIAVYLKKIEELLSRKEDY